MASGKADDDYEDDFHSDEEGVTASPAPPGSVAASTAPPVAAAASSASLPIAGRRASGAAGAAAVAAAAAPSPAPASTAAAAEGWQEIAARDLVVGDQLGGGGFAVVYRGEYRRAPVAIKMIVDPDVTAEQTEAFLRELSVLASLHHPGIIKLVGAVATPPRQCIVMELAGRSLFSVLHEGTAPLPLGRRLAWAADAAAALAYLHSRKPLAVIHRDVKSLNFLLAPAPTTAGGSSLRLCDFGLVGSRDIDAGTPAYMAPELWGARTFSKSVDVFAFGIMLWELVARAVPFAGWRPADIRDGVLRGERPPLSRLPGDTPSAVTDLIVACWDGAPAKRPDMATVADTLARVAAAAATSSGGGARRPSTGSTGSGGAGGGRGGASGGGGDALDALARVAAPPRPAASRARPL